MASTMHDTTRCEGLNAMNGVIWFKANLLEQGGAEVAEIMGGEAVGGMTGVGAGEEAGGAAAIVAAPEEIRKGARRRERWQGSRHCNNTLVRELSRRRWRWGRW